jgi:hypothetical protein
MPKAREPGPLSLAGVSYHGRVFIPQPLRMVEMHDCDAIQFASLLIRRLDRVDRTEGHLPRSFRMLGSEIATFQPAGRRDMVNWIIASGLTYRYPKFWPSASNNPGKLSSSTHPLAAG